MIGKEMILAMEYEIASYLAKLKSRRQRDIEFAGLKMQNFLPRISSVSR